MKSKTLFILFSFFISGVSLASEVKETRDGIYEQKVKLNYGAISYIVDTKAKICILAYTGVTTIPCESLANREEWKPVLDWIK